MWHSLHFLSLRYGRQSLPWHLGKILVHGVKTLLLLIAAFSLGSLLFMLGWVTHVVCCANHQLLTLGAG